MNERIEGIAVSRGIAIGRAMVLGHEPLHVRHYLIQPAEVENELVRLQRGFTRAQNELRRVQQSFQHDAIGDDLQALLEVHAMLLEDDSLREGAADFIRERRYNAEWALMQQLARLSREFDVMDNSYLRERKVDLEQLISRVVLCMRASENGVDPESGSEGGLLDRSLWERETSAHEAEKGSGGEPQSLIIVAHDLAPANMLHFRHAAFGGFVVDTGGVTSHAAIVARSMDIPAVVGTRNGTQKISQDDLLIVHANAGIVIVNPDEQMLQRYQLIQQDLAQEGMRQKRLLAAPVVTRDGQAIELLANVDLPGDCQVAMQCGAAGIGLFRSEFLFMGRQNALPDEAEQYGVYREAISAMQGLPVTIRTVDVGADKPLDGLAGSRYNSENSVLGLRAIRWSLARPEMFRTQLRALLRAAVHGPLSILFPMLVQVREVHQVLEQLRLAREELQARGEPFGNVRLGAMIEVPAAALIIDQFLLYFDFVSIGTNDLTQYTLAVDRANESVADLFDVTHPAVLRLIAHVIARCRARQKPVSLCGEIAGDPRCTDLLLGLGLRSFSMHPTQVLAVKEQILEADTCELGRWALEVMGAEDPQAMLRSRAGVPPEMAATLASP